MSQPTATPTPHFARRAAGGIVAGARALDRSSVMQVLKQRFAHRVLQAWRDPAAQGRLWEEGMQAGHVWQRRFYDFVVFTESKRIEKLRYMHRNPVKRGLVLEPEQWEWSSFRSYAYREDGRVKINQWPEPVLKIRPAA